MTLYAILAAARSMVTNVYEDIFVDARICASGSLDQVLSDLANHPQMLHCKMLKMMLSMHSLLSNTECTENLLDVESVGTAQLWMSSWTVCRIYFGFSRQSTKTTCMFIQCISSVL